MVDFFVQIDLEKFYNSRKKLIIKIEFPQKCYIARFLMPQKCQKKNSNVLKLKMLIVYNNDGDEYV